MRIRIFGGSSCKDCLEMFVILNKYGIDYEYIDAFDDGTQKLCDKHDVDELPHVQFIEKEAVLVEHRGPFNETDFTQCLAIYFPNY